MSLLVRFHVLIAMIFAGLPVASASTVSHEFISSGGNNKIEYFWSKPDGPGPFPLLMFIHPEQEAPKVGGQVFVQNGQLEHWVQRGYAVVAVSQPGYGGSEGEPDFCGPGSQAAAMEVLKHLQAKPEINPKRMFVYGGSRGAVVASMIATRELPLAGVILKSGVYDFIQWSESRPWYDAIKLTMFWEIGWLTDEKLKARSATYFADRIKAPVLLIHGSQDTRAPIEIAETFAKKINSAGGNAQLIKIASEHVIPMTEIEGIMGDFMKAH